MRTVALVFLTLLLISCSSPSHAAENATGDSAPSQVEAVGQGMTTYYLEIVTEDVDAVCAAYEAAAGVKFSEPDPFLGNARTANLNGGGLVGVRAPMRDTEAPVVRPYWLVSDIEAALAAAVEAGGEVALPPMEIPGRGTFAIYLQGGNEHGLWQSKP